MKNRDRIILKVTGNLLMSKSYFCPCFEVKVAQKERKPGWLSKQNVITSQDNTAEGTYYKTLPGLGALECIQKGTKLIFKTTNLNKVRGVLIWKNTIAPLYQRQT